MAKKEKTMAKKEKIICKECKYFDGEICRHKSNTIIYINKKIEKVKIKSTELKIKCEYFE